MVRIPLRLARPPLVEATFEVRFIPAANVTGELLPGMLFPLIGHRYGNAHQTPAAAIPREMRLARPELKYTPQFRLDGGSQSLLLGDNVVALSSTPPYPGWDAFREQCCTVIEALKSTSFVGSVERYSLRYTNILPLRDRNPLDAFNIRLDVAGVQLEPDGFRLRFEERTPPFITVVECSARMQALLSATQTLEGVLFALDTIRQVGAESFFHSPGSHLDQAHSVLEELFFRLLSTEVIEAMAPTWGDQ